MDHGSCGGSFKNGTAIVDKIRQMGLAEQNVTMILDIICPECTNAFEMVTYETKCPQCDMVFGVTPCHAFSVDNVMPAGINYQHLNEENKNVTG